MSSLLCHLFVHLLQHLVVVFLAQLLKYLSVRRQKNLRANFRVKHGRLALGGNEMRLCSIWLILLVETWLIGTDRTTGSGVLSALNLLTRSLCEENSCEILVRNI